MFKIAICDDEKLFINVMKEIIEKYLNDSGVSYEIDTYCSGEELVELGLDIMNYSVIFLDINMDIMDGITTARKIREISKDVFLVFITAFVNYTLEGYKVDAVRYILKNQDNLAESVKECMEAIRVKMNHKVIWKEYRFNEGYRKVSLERLIYVESQLHKLVFYIMEDRLTKYTLYQTLNTIENELAENNFVRIHQSFPVNMKYIKSVSRYIVLLYNGIQLNIPKARYKFVEDSFVAYKGEV